MMVIELWEVHMPEPIRILIVDDNAAVRTDLRLVLELEDGVQVVGEAANSEDAILEVRDLKPDIVVMDLEMPGLEACTAIRMIKNQAQAPGVYVLTVHGYKSAEQAAFRAGADEFFVKGQDLNQMIDRIHQFRIP